MILTKNKNNILLKYNLFFKSNINKNYIFIKINNKYKINCYYSNIYNPLINFKIPNFLNLQRESFQTFLKIDLIKEFKQLKKITNADQTIEILFYIDKYKLVPPKWTIKQSILKRKTYNCQLFIPVQIINHNTKESIIDWLLLMNLPLMTKNGHFIINGSPKIIMNQIVRSPGIYFQKLIKQDQEIFYSADFIAQRGTWLRLEIDSKNGDICAKMKKTPKIPINIFLRCLGISLPIFNNYLNSYKLNINNEYHNLKLLNNKNISLQKNKSLLDYNKKNKINANSYLNLDKNFDELVKKIYLKSKLQDSNIKVKEIGKKFLYEKFLNPRLYNLSKLGRLRINKKLGINISENHTLLTAKDILFSCFYLMQCLKGIEIPTDIDDLQNRQIRSSGKLIQIQLITGILRFEKNIRDKLILNDKLNKTTNFIFGYNKLKNGFFVNNGISNSILLVKKDQINIVKRQLDIIKNSNNIYNIKKNIFSYFELIKIKKYFNLVQKTEKFNILNNINKKNNLLQISTNKIKIFRENQIFKFKNKKNLNLEIIINSKLFNNVLREFFNTNPLVQLLDQTNPLAEITHKRRLSSLGPGGISRDTAGMAIRGIHPTHYGRICPIETPEGQNAGLVNSFTIYSSLNVKGFIETPFYKMYKGFILLNQGLFLFSSDQEKNFNIAPGDIKKNKLNFLPGKIDIPCRQLKEFKRVSRIKMDYIAINSIQMISIATSLIPFLEHNDGNRALMGSNMQRQAVPIIKPTFPIVGTGLESNIIANINYAIQAKKAGLVTYVDGKEIIVLSSRKNLFNKFNFKLKDFNKFTFNYKLKKINKELSINKNYKNIINNNINLNKIKKVELNLFGFNKFVYLNNNKLYFKNLKINNFSLFNIKNINNIFNLNFENYNLSLFEIIYYYSKKTNYYKSKFKPFLSKNNLFLLKKIKNTNLIINYSNIIIEKSPLTFYLNMNFLNMPKINSKRIKPNKIISPIYFNLLLNKINLPKTFYFNNELNKNLILNFSFKLKNFSDFYTKRKNIKLSNNRFIKKNINLNKQIYLNSLIKINYFNVKNNNKVIINNKKKLYTHNLLKKKITQSFNSYFFETKTNYLNFKNIFLSTNFSILKYSFDHINLVNKNKLLKVKVNYKCDPFYRSNQDTYLVHRPIVNQGQWVESGDILADNSTSCQGELSIGQNLLIGYLPWEGYNFEDAVLINKRLVYDDIFTSLHIERYETEIRDTQFGPEELTPTLNEKNSFNYLNDNGIVKLGTWIEEGDILVGKVSPIGQKKLSAYEKLLYDIIGKSIPKTKDTSLRVPLGIKGRVVHIELIEKEIPSNLNPLDNNNYEKIKIIKNKNFFIYKFLKKKNFYLKNNFVFSKLSIEKLNLFFENKLIKNTKIKKKFYLNNFYNFYYYKTKNKKQLKISTNIEKFLLKQKNINSKIKYKKRKRILLFPFFNILEKNKLNNYEKIKYLKIFHNSFLLNKLKNRDFFNKKIFYFLKNKNPNFIITSLYNFIFKIGFKKSNYLLSTLKYDNKIKNNTIKKITKVHIYIAQKRKIQVGDKIAGRHGNKGIISNILSSEDMPYLPDGSPLDLVLNPLGVPSRMNVGQIFECLLGLAGAYLGQCYKIQPFDEIYGSEASRSLVYSKLYEARIKTGQYWLFNPNFPGKIRLFDGRTGDCFEQPSTVGKAYILKLIHQVDEKIHARSTGPYSLITQQPLRGRSKQGGQRVGEMEVWALEGFGASYILQELLTIKSDDIEGRNKLTKSIINNKSIKCGTPESFKVLIRELQALCLDISIYKIASTGKPEKIDINFL
uniref:DNA-directed RNA polymerase subunit beta n=2 Tax=Ulva TaxID=3118 RepID=A0A8F0HY49_9CHLO|nr:DNA-directed RNA polymerase subunit beta [Ulva rigida]QOK35603.1 DNA-directed RNA polymerase subunit beta [Ulva rigida]QWL15232.1 RNA polymerase beta subunit [Ulva rigida]